MRESQIEQYLIDAVTFKGGLIRKLTFPGHRGAPDRVVMLPGGRLIWVECKAPGMKPEPHQLREHNRMRLMGQCVEVVDSFDRVDEVLA